MLSAADNGLMHHLDNEVAFLVNNLVENSLEKSPSATILKPTNSYLSLFSPKLKTFTTTWSLELE